MYGYILLPKAARQLDKEIEHSRNNWGVSHASKYRLEIMKKVRGITENPKMYPLKPAFGKGMRSVRHKGNYIIYRVEEDKKTVLITGFPSIYKLE